MSTSSITKYFIPLKKTVNSPNVEAKGKRLSAIRKNQYHSNSGSPSCNNNKKQLLLDLGQRNFGPTICSTCGMLYSRAQPEDEIHHEKFHHRVVYALRFNGWKTERIVEHFHDGRIIVISSQDHSSHLKKVASIVAVVDDELGFSSETSLRMKDSKTYLFIAEKKVVGCVVAVPIEEAFPVIPCPDNDGIVKKSENPTLCCSSVAVRSLCGISRIWVLQEHRRKKIATRLLDCVRMDFLFEGVVTKELLAFSDPTPLGGQFAEFYCGTESFLVFR